MSMFEKLTKIQSSRPKGSGGTRTKGGYHSWNEGTNTIRLAGDGIDVRTHYLAPNPKRKDRGLCGEAAFTGDEKIPKTVNCLNWDIAMERPRKEKTCPICKLNAIAKTILAENEKAKEKLTAEEKKFFEAIKSASRATAALKWNVLDRDNPMITVEKDGKEEKILGFKIATVGTEACNDITGIYQQIGYDIQDPDRGIDIEVIKDSTGARTTYSARAVIQGLSVKVTPFTKEEKALVMNDLKVRCGKQTEEYKIIDALHEDLREILNAKEVDANVTDDESVDAAVEAAIADVADTKTPESKPVSTPVKVSDNSSEKAPVPTAGKVPASVLDRLQKKNVATGAEESVAVADALQDDDDDILTGTSKKK